MENKVSHTPTPWKYQKPQGSQHAIDRKVEIVSPCLHGGEVVVAGEHTGIECLTPENAALIVRAVNAHDELVGFLREISSLAKENSHSVQDGYAMIAEWADKALAKAEGK